MGAEDTRARALAVWEEEAATLEWARPWSVLADEEPGPEARWFADAGISVAANCLDRHLEDRGDTVALHWEGEPGERRQLTY